MWSYYGRKYKIINKYPAPKYMSIIEPFAGTASYSYRYWYYHPCLIDSYSVIIRIWKYLQDTDVFRILSLPDVENAEYIGDKYPWLSQEERWLIGFCINNGSSLPKHTAGRMNFNSWHRDRKRIAEDLYKIKHWRLINGDYRCIENIKATWFIDPPYQHGGESYKESNINYEELAEWCKTRKGQVIVCENSKADWLDFKPLVELSGQRNKTMEVIWTN